jgi:hypothetical protein
VTATRGKPVEQVLRAWAKIAVMAQSAISLVLLGLAIARAVSVLI